MRKACLACILALAALAAWSQPKVAVLDTQVPQSIDQSVVIPTTEKIIERLVVSGRYTVLDRANIESVLKEREFQLSGMVSDQDVVTAGKYLGADFVVVAKVQKVSDTYFITAKMIAIKTGVIANQTSAQGEGKLSTLISLAEQVGDVLSGGAVLAQSAVGGQKDISKPEGEAAAPKSAPKAEKAPRSAPASPSGSTSVLVGIDALPTTWEESYSDIYDGTFTVKFDYLALSVGLDLRYLEVGASFGTRTNGTRNTVYGGVSSGDSDITDEESYIGLSVYGKLPISFGRFSVFPMLGAEYLLTTSLAAADGTDFLDNLNALGESLYLGRLFVEAGLGLDFNLGSKIFARGIALYGMKIPSSYDDAYISEQEALGYVNESVSVSLLKFNFSVGFRF
jgi:hypothetical protein